MRYEKLLKEADDHNLIVKEKDLITKDGLCKGNKIAISKKLNNSEKYCVLAEEIGHYFLNTGNILDQKDINNNKQELIARRWGYNHIVSLEGIIQAIEHNCINRFEIAEYLGVTDRYFEECINEYKKQYGLYKKVKNYLIYFEPSLGILKTI